jgi:hypothetical protein
LAQLSSEIRILAILYLLNGVFCLTFAGLFIYGLVNHQSVLPTRVSEDIPITGGVIGSIIFGYILLTGVGFLGSCVFFRIAYGLRQGKRWAKTHGLLLSVLAVAIVLLLLRPIYGMIAYSLTTPWFYLTGGVAAFSLIFLIANVLSLYYLTRPQVKAYLHQP